MTKRLSVIVLLLAASPSTTWAQSNPSERSSSSAANKAYNDRAYQEMIDMAKNKNAKAKAEELPPTAAVPYWHTKQTCTGRNGKKGPCRIYR